ncbi:class C beta-lactamase-related serine hydrolase [Cryobacterium sp. TMT2-10]|uniref:Class C beta-lactamase-related serine hydrolase n=1 Tax=Cryobacterium shii TaxID=1259235 RepID=A0AAQ2C515_9MICO|nr:MULTISPECIES: serine hydrolase [Cryobacterium]TFC44352.1 class C beta-lactamase-related serine hydrolase [Cryobacterium shii]TFD20929.1 class C beta-lactamase-related serine hydrolase [Cryobacterium sp. TMT4-10]TFD35797.1 class C beta-lactamase-related serine hydrolase [Cryobacterium sp. TMT2-10]
MTPLPRSTPEAEGMSSQAILDFVAAAEQLESLHSLMVVRHGRVVAEGWWHPYAAQHPHLMFSVSKSFTSTAIGLAIGEGRLTLDDLVVDLLPDDLPAQIDPHLAALSVRHLLTMTTGHPTDTVSLADDSHGDNWARTILTQPLEFAPGSHYVYNSGASYLLSAILQRLTGERLFDYLTPRLFDPLGIVSATWQTCPRGIDAGGWGLSITTEQLATFGQLLLQRGEWNGTRLVAAEWIDEATSTQVDTSGTEHDVDGREGYGYQFWRNRPTGYRADGAFGQFCLVLPETDAVITLTSALPTAQRALDLVWEHLLPAFTDHPIPELKTGLAGTLASLTLPTVIGERTSPTAARVAGIRFNFDDAEVTAATLEPGLLTIIRGGTARPIAFGHGEWVASGDARVLASGAWVSPKTLVVRAHNVGTPFSRTYTLDFGTDALTLDIEQNVAFGDLPHTRLVSR